MNRALIHWRLLLTLLLVGLILAVADLLTSSVSIVLLIFTGLLFGIFLNGLSGWVARFTRLSYGWAYGVVVVLLLALIAGGVYYLGSQIVEQVSTLSSELQAAVQQAGERARHYQWVDRWLPDPSQFQESLSDGSVASQVMKGLGWVTWGLTGIVVVFFVGLYVAFDPHLYKTGLVKLVPQPRRDRGAEVLDRLHSALARWIVGRLVSMAIIGVFTGIGLWLFGVPLPVTLAVLAALLTFIPSIGPVLAAVPQAFLALKVGTATALYVILFNIGLQAVESYLVTPMVQRYQVTLPPALTVSVQLLMAVLVGAIGVITAAPLTVTFMVFVQMLYIRDRLADPTPGRLAGSQ